MSTKAESRPYRTSDTLLVRIAERPLVVAALFLLTALLPWVFYLLLPALNKAVHTGAFLNFLQWLPAPILFVLVNFAIFFIWMNSGRSRSRGPLISEDWSVIDDPKKVNVPVVSPKKFDADSADDFHAKKSDAESADVFELFFKGTAPGLRENLATESPASDCLASESPAVQPSSPSAKTISADKPPMKDGRKPGHKKSRSLKENLCIDPKILEELEVRHVTRRNSQPKSQTPGPKRSEDKSSSFHENTYSPPVRTRQQPVPLERDDLNVRIEDFLTKFKMQRQESNLKALSASASLQ